MEKVRDKLRLPTHVTRVDLARLSGFTKRWLMILENQGVIDRDKEGRYKLIETMTKVVEYVRKTEKKRSTDTSAEKLRTTKSLEVERRMAREDRTLVTLEEAMEVVDFLTGRFAEALTTLPAKVTKDAQARNRFEAEVDVIRNELAEDLAKAAGALTQGVSPHEVTEEDDA